MYLCVDFLGLYFENIYLYVWDNIYIYLFIKVIFVILIDNWIDFDNWFKYFFLLKLCKIICFVEWGIEWIEN